jgi:hypothetical protein
MDRKLRMPVGLFMFPMWTMNIGLPGPNMIPARSWSIPDQCLLHCWSICGPYGIRPFLVLPSPLLTVVAICSLWVPTSSLKSIAQWNHLYRRRRVREFASTKITPVCFTYCNDFKTVQKRLLMLYENSTDDKN